MRKEEVSKDQSAIHTLTKTHKTNDFLFYKERSEQYHTDSIVSCLRGHSGFDLSIVNTLCVTCGNFLNPTQ